MKPQKFEADLAGKKLTIEVGQLAQQAHGSCTVRYGDTVVLAAATMGGIRDGINYFPLSVEYEEKLYAAGKIKGSRWIKREGRPTDEAVLTGRMIDRCIRPLFSKEIKNEVQVVLTVLSFDNENDADMVALIGASTALAMSKIPWGGPLAGVRVSKTDGELVVNPTFEQREQSEFAVVVSGLNEKVLMIEAEGKEALEDDIYKGIEAAIQPNQDIIALINKVVEAVGVEKVEITAPETDEEELPKESMQELLDKSTEWIKQNVPSILFDTTLPTKSARKAALGEAKEKMLAYLEEEGIGKDRRKKALPLVDEFVDTEITRALIEEERRVDGRKLDQIRELTSAVGLLPRTHGSGLFNRGETQVLSIVTLGSPGDEQLLDGLTASGTKRYMHHYNFPPYSVGEAGRMTGPGRRDIGHGALAEKALAPVLPSKEEFPYTIRVVSEVLGSNGSSSMGATCGSTLSLMDAGVPIKKPVAGIAIGLASNDKGEFKVLTDLQDMEDGQGGMDFKIAGTKDGITAIQLDTKTQGLSLEICKQALDRGLKARLEILDVMTEAIPEYRNDLSAHAPRIISFKINPDKIRDVIGPGGKIINEIIEKHEVQIDIEQDGLVMITAINAEGGKKASEWIHNIVREVEVGEEFEGKVSRVMDFGAIVDILPNQDGMVHISELAHQRVEKVEDIVKLGDIVKVKVVSRENGRISLSMKALLPKPEGTSDSKPRSPRPRH